MKTGWMRLGALAPTIAIAGGLFTMSGEAAQARNFAQKHPILTGIAAAGVAHHYAKRNRRIGRHRNFAERHPILTGAAVAGAAHHFRRRHR